MFKISPDETLKDHSGTLREKAGDIPENRCTSPSTAVSKEIYKISAVSGFCPLRGFCREGTHSGTWKQIAKTKYVNDKQITDHSCDHPDSVRDSERCGSLESLAAKVYELIGRRF